MTHWGKMCNRVYLSFFLNAKLYNKHIFIYRTISSCYGNWNLGSSRECIVTIVPWAWRNRVLTSDMGFEHHWKRESLLLVPWIPFLNTLFSDKLYCTLKLQPLPQLCSAKKIHYQMIFTYFAWFEVMFAISRKHSFTYLGNLGEIESPI